ncbi:hypothetical protein ACFL9T_07350 [Thermodesulfobacteriota bacterium]
MRLLIGLIGMALLSSACATAPPVGSFAHSKQKQMLTAQHWDIVARSVAQELAETMKAGEPSLTNGKGIYVQPMPGVFGQAFTKMLIDHLLASGMKVCKWSMGCSILEFDTQVIKHKANEMERPLPRLLTPLGLGIYLAGSVSEWGYGTAILAAVLADYYLLDSYKTMKANSEVIITASVVENDRYVFQESLIYYINQADWQHYPTENSSATARSFKVKGD